MLKQIVLGVVGVAVVGVLGLVGVASTKPDTFHIERSTTIAAPPAKVYPLISDFHQWTKWSPWEKMDPNLQRTYEGAEAGKGAVYTWKGNDNVGAGRMEITEATEPEVVAIKLDFTAPFQASNTAKFTLLPEGEGTKVTWAMDGPSPLVSKIMDTLMNMDAMIGKDFEKGLADMKAAAEAPAAATP